MKKTESAQLKQLEAMAKEIHELEPQLALLNAAIPKNFSRQGEIRKAIAGFPASDLLEITPKIQDLWVELSRLEFLHSHTGNCKARISNRIALLEGQAQRLQQEFLTSFRRTISDHLTAANKIWALSLRQRQRRRQAPVAVGPLR